MKILPLLLASLTLTGCASGPFRHLLTTGVAAGGGALIGNLASDGNPAITAAAATGGALLGEAANHFQTKAESKSYTAGYDKGRSDSVKALYWLLQRQQAPQGEGMMLYPVPIPAQEVDGVKYQATTKYITLPR